MQSDMRMGAGAGSGLETSLGGEWSNVVSSHHGLHAAMRSNRLDARKATWMSLKTSC